MAIKPSRSVARETSDRTRTFPSYDDLAAYLIEIGEVSDPDELTTSRVELLSDLFVQWIRGGQHSCAFARRLAARIPADRWLPFVVAEPTNDLPGDLESLLNPPLEETEAVLVILPGIDTPEAIVDVMGALCRHPSWFWKEIPWEGLEDPERFLAGLRWRLPDEGHVSWVLGFGPFDSMPFTRRVIGAPFSVLAIRHRWPPSNTDETFGNSTLPSVHLANMPLELETQDLVDQFAKKTGEDKRALLGDEHRGAAKARVTFALPISVRDAMPDPEA